MKGVETKSAGTSIVAVNKITKELIQWADMIFVMEEKHERALARIDRSSRDKVRVLDIPDIFHRDQPELKKLLLERMRPYLTELAARARFGEWDLNPFGS
jgi:predicted protein tyrosine phosphatase